MVNFFSPPNFNKHSINLKIVIQFEDEEKKTVNIFFIFLFNINSINH